MRSIRRHPSSRPFMAAPRVDFYHPARDIDSALHAVERVVRRAEGIGLVIGPAGTGKSLLLAKLAEHLRDDFDVALLSGARICTRRALWQSILAEIGEPYRGLDEGDLRIGIVERIRGLAATGAGLVILVDEAHTLPSRLIEELRLLTNLPTPLPAVHIALVGTAELEEMLGATKMESVAQRIATRHYLEPLDHAETMSYLRTQARSAGREWETLFETGCDDAIFTACDGVPRLINQLCDHALVLAGEAGRGVATAADIAAAWRDIQRLPPPGPLARAQESNSHAARPGDLADGSDRPAARPVDQDFDAVPRHGGQDALFGAGGDVGVIEFGAFDATAPEAGVPDGSDDTIFEIGGAGALATGPEPPVGSRDPIHGPEVELVFDSSADPFAELFEDDEGLVERMLMRGPDDFSTHRHVTSREGTVMARQLSPFERPPRPVDDGGGRHPEDVAAALPPTAAVDHAAGDDADMVVIEEDLLQQPARAGSSVFAVRPGDYRRLFARLRRGDRA